MSPNPFGLPVFEGFDLSDTFLVIFLSIYAALMLGALAGSVILYILQSRGMYTIAKRRGIHHPVLAWFPIANWWILGCISDQYQYVAKGNVRNSRKRLLWLCIGMYAALLAFIAIFVYFTAGAIETRLQDTALILPMLGWYAVYIACMVLSVVGTVFMSIALFDLYRSCKPATSVMFLVLSIIFSLHPIFIFIDRNFDIGMPPRRGQAEPVFSEPVPEIVYAEDDSPTADEDDFE